MVSPPHLPAHALWELAPHARETRRLPGFIGPNPSTSLDECNAHMKF